METRGFAHINTTAVVCYLQQFQASFFDKDLERGRPCIDGILDELLQRMNGGNNNLSSSDLVDNILIKGLRSLFLVFCVVISKGERLPGNGQKDVAGEPTHLNAARSGYVVESICLSLFTTWKYIRGDINIHSVSHRDARWMSRQYGSV